MQRCSHLSGFLGTLFALLMILGIGFLLVFLVHGVRTRWPRLLRAGGAIPLILSGAWVFSVIYMPTRYYQDSPVVYLWMWGTMFIVIGIWFFFVTVVEPAWGAKAVVSFLNFVRSGGFWGNHFARNFSRFASTRDNGWANRMCVVLVICAISAFLYGSPWFWSADRSLHSAHSTVANAYNNTLDAAKNIGSVASDVIEDSLSEAGTLAKRVSRKDFYEVLRDSFRGTNTIVEKVVEHPKVSYALKDVSFSLPRMDSPSEVKRSYPASGGWIFACILAAIYTVFAIIWSRRDWVADILEKFSEWLKSRKKEAGVVLGAVTSGRAVPVPSPATASAPAAEASTSLGREVGKEIVAEGLVEGIKQIIEATTKRVIRFFRKH